MRINREISESTDRAGKRDTNICFILIHIVSEFLLLFNEVLLTILYATSNPNLETWYILAYIFSFSTFIADLGLVFVVDSLRHAYKTRMIE